MQQELQTTLEDTGDQIKTETQEGLAQTYKAVFDLICDGKLALSDISLLDNCAKGQGIFSLEARYDDTLDPDEVIAIEARYEQAKARVKDIAELLPPELQDYADASWAYVLLTDEVSFSKGVTDYWASKIARPDENNEEALPSNPSTRSITPQEIKAVLNTITLVEKNISQFDTEGNPYYLFAGSTELWLLKIADPQNWRVKNADGTYDPLQLSAEQREALKAWKRPIHDVDCCVPQNSGVNTKVLFNYGQIEHAEAIFDIGNSAPDEPVYNAEFRPTASDINRYLELNLGGFRLSVATPEYCLAFKRLHLLQHPDKENAQMDLALLQTLATNPTEVEKVYQENLALVVSTPENP